MFAAVSTGVVLVAIVFTDNGARKMRDLSAAQANKLIAIVLDGEVISAPRVRAEISKEAVISGNGPNGLSPADSQRILESLKRK